MARESLPLRAPTRKAPVAAFAQLADLLREEE